MKQYLAVIDTNVLVSALLASLKEKDTAPLRILSYVLDAVIKPVFNNEILEEYRDVLNRPKFNFSKESVNKVIRAVETLGIYSDRVSSDEICKDPKDVVFYEVSLSTDDTYLVTGNIKDFPAKPFVVTPALMLEIIDQVH